MSDWLIAAAAWVMVYGSEHRPWKIGAAMKIFGIKLSSVNPTDCPGMQTYAMCYFMVSLGYLKAYAMA